jgi:hypothetical protein
MKLMIFSIFVAIIALFLIHGVVTAQKVTYSDRLFSSLTGRKTISSPAFSYLC